MRGKVPSRAGPVVACSLDQVGWCGGQHWQILGRDICEKPAATWTYGQQCAGPRAGHSLTDAGNLAPDVHHML